MTEENDLKQDDETEEVVVQDEQVAEKVADVAEVAEEQAGEEVVVTLGDEPAAEEEEKRAPEWLRDLRKANREKERRIRELEARLAIPDTTVTVGKKPTLEACEYDTDKYEAELESWHARKREADEKKRQQEREEEQQRQQWQTRIDAVRTAASGLRVSDYDDAGAAFDDTFSAVQQGIIIGGPDDPKSSALLRYALGKNPNKARELAAIKDPVKFAFAISKLENQLKVTPRKAAPTPESRVKSNVAGATAVDSQLARLQAEANKTGDRSKVVAYHRAKRKAA